MKSVQLRVEKVWCTRELTDSVTFLNFKQLDLNILVLTEKICQISATFNGQIIVFSCK